MKVGPFDFWDRVGNQSEAWGRAAAGSHIYGEWLQVSNDLRRQEESESRSDVQ